MQAARAAPQPAPAGGGQLGGADGFAVTSSGCDPLTAALTRDSETDGLLANDSFMMGLHDSLGRKSLATSEHAYQNKVQKLTADSSARAAKLRRQALAAGTQEERLQLLNEALAESARLVGIQHTALDVANMRAKGFKHATAAKVIGGAPEQRELVRGIASLPDDVLGALGGFITTAASRAAAAGLAGSALSLGPAAGPALPMAAYPPGFSQQAAPQLAYQVVGAAGIGGFLPPPPPPIPQGLLPPPPPLPAILGAHPQAPAGARPLPPCYNCGQTGHVFLDCDGMKELAQRDAAAYAAKVQQFRNRQLQDRPPRGQRNQPQR